MYCCLLVSRTYCSQTAIFGYANLVVCCCALRMLTLLSVFDPSLEYSQQFQNTACLLSISSCHTRSTQLTLPHHDVLTHSQTGITIPPPPLFPSLPCQGVSAALGDAVHIIEVRRQLFHTSRVAMEWLHRRCPHITESGFYLVEPLPAEQVQYITYVYVCIGYCKRVLYPLVSQLEWCLMHYTTLHAQEYCLLLCII